MKHSDPPNICNIQSVAMENASINYVILPSFDISNKEYFPYYLSLNSEPLYLVSGIPSQVKALYRLRLVTFFISMPPRRAKIIIPGPTPHWPGFPKREDFGRDGEWTREERQATSRLICKLAC